MVNGSLQKIFVHPENNPQSNSRKSTLSTSQSASLRNSIQIETDSPKSNLATPKINIELTAAKKFMKNKKHPLHQGGSPGAIDMSDMFRDNKGRRTSILGIPAMQEEAIFTQVLAKNRSNVDRKFADLVRLVKEKDQGRKSFPPTPRPLKIEKIGKSVEMLRVFVIFVIFGRWPPLPRYF